MIPLLAAVLLSLPPTASCEAAWNDFFSREMPAAADSIAVVESLSGANDECSLLLRAYLSAFLSERHFKDWRKRVEIRRGLERYLKKHPDEPRAYLALGYLKYRQRTIVDARRMLKRAEERAQNASPPFTLREKAIIALLKHEIGG